MSRGSSARRRMTEKAKKALRVERVLARPEPKLPALPEIPMLPIDPAFVSPHAAGIGVDLAVEGADRTVVFSRIPDRHVVVLTNPMERDTFSIGKMIWNRVQMDKQQRARRVEETLLRMGAPTFSFNTLELDPGDIERRIFSKLVGF